MRDLLLNLFFLSILLSFSLFSAALSIHFIDFLDRLDLRRRALQRERAIDKFEQDKLIHEAQFEFVSAVALRECGWPDECSLNSVDDPDNLLQRLGGFRFSPALSFQRLFLKV